jgi:hypothetical protein
MKKYLIVLITFFTLYSCIQEHPIEKGTCRAYISLITILNDENTSDELKQERIDRALTVCLLEYFSLEYSKPTPPLERNQDGY